MRKSFGRICKHFVQEPTLFARTIKKNIIFGLEETEFEPTDEEVVDAAKLANAHQFIMAMEKGYDTEVGERGVQLSGGQVRNQFDSCRLHYAFTFLQEGIIIKFKMQSLAVFLHGSACKR